MAMDFKKVFREQYQPTTTPSIIEIPTMPVIRVDGAGDPNTSEDYRSAIEVLYALSYAIKMGNKDTLDYVVPPLEGLWTIDGELPGPGGVVADKARFVWTSLIRQPDFVDSSVFENAVEAVARKKPKLDASTARLEMLDEGLCVQVMHIGPYDTESTTIAKLDPFAVDHGYVIDLSPMRRHHEIYLSDPRRTEADKMKTIIRHPVRRAR